MRGSVHVPATVFSKQGDPGREGQPGFLGEEGLAVSASSLVNLHRGHSFTGETGWKT